MDCTPWSVPHVSVWRVRCVLTLGTDSCVLSTDVSLQTGVKSAVSQPCPSAFSDVSVQFRCCFCRAEERCSQPMVTIRHPRHRTGVHTDAVTTSSGPPGPTLIIATLDVHTTTIHTINFSDDQTDKNEAEDPHLPLLQLARQAACGRGFVPGLVLRPRKVYSRRVRVR